MLLTKIRNCDYSFCEEHWQGISDEAKDLISQLLQTDDKLRPSAQEILKHPWLQQGVPETPLQTPEILRRYEVRILVLANCAHWPLASTKSSLAQI